ncbi:MAG: carbohydrate kinase family protein [bacterium]|nr:carbohydrate kinase family protein [bacterium]
MLCCIGDLVEDVVVWPSTELIQGTDTPARIFRRRGGSAANVAVIAARQGRPSRFIGQVGEDSLGSLLATEMEQAGVELALARGGTTGSIVVIVDDTGERTMLPDRSAATELSSLPEGALDAATWLHVPAYSLIVEPLGSSTRHAMSIARQRGIGVSVDASSTGPLTEYGIVRFLDDMKSLGPDVFFCNKDEADLLGVNSAAPLEGGGLTVIKAGADPVVVVDHTGTATTVTVPPVAAVADTTGAGDAFAAGFLTATLAGAIPAAAAAEANRVAATVLLRPGAGSHHT